MMYVTGHSLTLPHVTAALLVTRGNGRRQHLLLEVIGVISQSVQSVTHYQSGNTAQWECGVYGALWET